MDPCLRRDDSFYFPSSFVAVFFFVQFKGGEALDEEFLGVFKKLFFFLIGDDLGEIFAFGGEGDGAVALHIDRADVKGASA